MLSGRLRGRAQGDEEGAGEGGRVRGTFLGLDISFTIGWAVWKQGAVQSCGATRFRRQYACQPDEHFAKIPICGGTSLVTYILERKCGGLPDAVAMLDPAVPKGGLPHLMELAIARWFAARSVPVVHLHCHPVYTWAVGKGRPGTLPIMAAARLKLASARDAQWIRLRPTGDAILAAAYCAEHGTRKPFKVPKHIFPHLRRGLLPWFWPVCPPDHALEIIL